ncbi:hypothetical protein, partial [Bradyrhizobium sp. AUGA SZCCT0182]|uniref:hypothetical protein n=1 Tax=Bradyrhizobium sp. AUGA SZCCT0182 TaxID=2807667 RepID=UPI001BAAB329
KTAGPDQPAADPSSIRSPAQTGRNELAITVGFNTEFFNTIGAKRTFGPLAMSEKCHEETCREPLLKR